MNAPPDAAVIVPAVLGVGLLFSVGAMVLDVLSRVQGARSMHRRSELEGRATGLAARDGLQSALQDREGLRPRWVYVLAAVATLGIGVYVTIGSVGNFVGLTPWSEGVAWLLVVLVGFAAAFGTVGVASAQMAARYGAPPAWARRVCNRTPLTTVAQAPTLPVVRDALRRIRPLDRSQVTDRVAATARRVATVWSLVATSTFGFLAFRGMVPQAESGTTVETGLVVPVQMGLLLVIVAATLLLRRAEAVHAAVLAGAGSALGVIAGVQYPPQVAMLVALAFLVPAFLHWLAWQRDQNAVHILRLFLVTALVVAGVWVGADRVYARFFGPTHPESTVLAAPPSAVEWAWAGGTTESETTVVAKLGSRHERVRIALAVGDDFSGARYSVAVRSGAGNHDVVRATFSSLLPDTSYRYAVEADGTLDLARQGRLRTFPAGAGDFTVAFGSCARTGSNGAVFDAVRAQDPLLYLGLGDVHYANIRTNDQSLFRSALDRTLASPAQSALYRSTSAAYVWDDHDYAGNDANASAPTRPAAQAVYRQYVPHYALPGGGRTGPIHQAFTIGRVRFLLTDNRSTRTPQTAVDGESKVLLGADQERWLVAELAAARARDGIVVWANPNPWVAAAVAGGDDWGGYTTQRARLADVIADLGLSGRLVMLSGDAHMLALDDGRHTDYSTARRGGFPLMQAAPLDRPPGLKGGPYSEGPFLGVGQFGLLRVHDAGADEITVRLSGHSWDDRVLVDRTFTLDARRSP